MKLLSFLNLKVHKLHIPISFSPITGPIGQFGLTFVINLKIKRYIIFILRTLRDLN